MQKIFDKNRNVTFGKKLKISIIFFVSSILSAVIGVLFFVACIETNVELFSLFSLFFAFIAFLLGIWAIVKIFANKVVFSLELIILLLIAFYLFSFCLLYAVSLSTRRSVSLNLELELKEITSFLDLYLKKYGSLPDANNWCISLIEKFPEVTSETFQISQLSEIECNFAFNENLSGLSLEQLKNKSDVVLFFEFDGKLNQSGGSELINKERTKDKHFLFKRQRFIYVSYVDGTIAKYRLGDYAIALYDKEKDKSPYYLEKDEFTDWFKRGETPYSPLVWK